MMMSDTEAVPYKLDGVLPTSRSNIKVSVAVKSNNSWTKTLSIDGSARNEEGSYIY